MPESSTNNKRIAKNTLLLYFRTIFIMLITLYTSRVILNVLGIKDYGIYNVVGGSVAMFSLLSGSLSSSISRFITFELGKKDLDRLKLVFITSINIQIGISIITFILGEIIGLWFLYTHMNIPDGRITAAAWVLHGSLLMFCINLISIPYNACIIAHERMTAFAYVSVLEAALKLAICYLIIISPFDKLISYSILLVAVSVIIRVVYGIYCSRHFDECHYRWTKDMSMVRDMTGFAGWSFFTNACYLFNTQGVNILINIFFGVTLNAARGIATQVEGAIMQFVNNFTMAVNPQITKNYATGNLDEMNKLVCRGAKFSYFLLLLFALPIMLEAEYILRLWLKIVPEHTVIFLRLTIIGSMITMLGNTGYTACMATGNIRRYVLYLSTIGCLVFPITWIAYKLGMPAESTYVIFILVYMGVTAVRLYIMHGLLGFPVMMFVNEVIWKIVGVTACSINIPLVLYNLIESSFARLILLMISCTVSTGTCIYLLGLTTNERSVIKEKTILTTKKLLSRYNQ